MNMDRRTALALLGAGAVWAQVRPEAGPRFFSAEEFRLVDRVSECIIPADEHSPGASAAKVALYIDLVAANSAPQVQRQWKRRLAAFDAGAQRRFGKRFLALSEGEQKRWMEQAAKSEFFADMRSATLAGYYTSPIGLQQELGYQGNSMMGSFPACQG